MIQAMREASREATKQGSALLARYFEDHPELAPNAQQTKSPDFSTTAYTVQLESDRLTRPVMDYFDAQVLRQQAVVDRFRFLSPAILVQSALNDISGTGVERYRHFLSQADRFLNQWKGYFLPRVFQRVKLTSDEIQLLPHYVFAEEARNQVAMRVLTALSGVLMATALLAWLAIRGLARYPVAGS
jgi:ABC-2 type transport system permease protein